MGAIRNLSGVGLARISLVAFLILAVGGVYLMPREEALAGWIYVKDGPVVVIGPNPVANKKGSIVTIAGVGFEPDQELGLRIMMGGAMSDVRFQVKPEPKTDAEGNFASEWKFGNELKMLGPGAHKLMVVNEAGDVLAQTVLVVGAAPAKKSKDKKK